MVRYLNFEQALDEMGKIHQNVDPSDSFESELFQSICDTLENLMTIYQEAKLTESEFNREALKFTNLYFEAYENIGFDYRME